VALASPADQVPFQPLIVELNDRDELLQPPVSTEQKPARKALDKALRAHAGTSADLGGDLLMAGKMDKALAIGFPGDTTLDAILEDLIDNLEATLVEERDDVADLIEVLEDGSPKDKAAAKLASADTLLGQAGAASTRSQRTALLRRTWKGLVKASRAASKGVVGVPTTGGAMQAQLDGASWQANSLFGAAVVGQIGVSEESEGLRRVVVSGRRFIPHTDPPPGSPGPYPGAQETFEIHVDAFTVDIATGTYFVAGGGGTVVTAVFTYEDEEGDVRTWIATSGSVTLSTLDVNLGSGSVTGSFGFTLYDPLTQNTRTIAVGTFSGTGLPRIELP
jgi:hypothetical protein